MSLSSFMTGVVLVNYCRPVETLRCVESLLQCGEEGMIRVFVVDNASPDDSLAILRKGLTDCGLDVELLSAPKNLGFAGGCNLGIRAFRKDFPDGFVWLLNNDAIAGKDCLDKMLAKAKESGAGVTGCALREPGSGELLSFGGKLSAWTGTVSAIRHKDVVRNMDYVEGASFLISAACLDSVGELDESYFLYYEEADYCFRAKNTGFTLACASDTYVFHATGTTTGSGRNRGEVPAFTDCIQLRSRLRFGLRYLFVPTVLIGFFVSLFLRVQRKQLGRIWIILGISLSEKAFREHLGKNPLGKS